MDFFLNNYTLIIHFVEVIAAITGIFYLKKFSKTPVKYFIYFLVYVAIIELIGAYPTYVEKFEYLSEVKELLRGTKFEENYWWYAIFWTIVSAVFYSFYFREFLESYNSIKTIKYITSIFIVSSLVYIAFNWNAFFVSSFYFVNIFSASVILLTVVLYFLEVLKSQKILTFYKSINFYIAAVLLVFFLIKTPLIFYDVYFSRSDMDYLRLNATINILCIVFMYVTFTFALIWCKPRNI
ncbi:hypothetical protein MWU58_09640 [Flavobacteriaceae bacterium S0825]|uniref:hypothetical protein n=1 Tax=Gaetbulibacter sp. S0825 TaxID=2720084 RepID=UPI00142FA1AD|nr:hypothetical protein [Gaetbulibacter sp. S0825]MCK0109555.1 hypothetical protein [Flavobacteriaceae bacterium S0825]NIX65188.1 hypothetical protein [Gaetbulibacter sp. S0825]